MSKEFGTHTADVFVVGGLNYDYVVRAARLPRPGESVQGRAFLEAPGGKGANQALAAARLGVPSVLLAKVGRDGRAKTAEEALLREGVDLSLLCRDDRAPTGVALVCVDKSGRKQITVAPGANARLHPSEIRKAEDRIRAAKILLVQLEIPVNAVKAAIEIARRAGVRVILDPAPARPIPATLLAEVDLIRPNDVEAEALTGISVKDRESAREAALKLLSAGVGAVIVQAGEEGDLLLTKRNEEMFLPRIPVEAVDATGAGDAFLGALAAELARGVALDEAARFASAAAAHATTVVGAQAGLPQRGQVERLLLRASRAA